MNPPLSKVFIRCDAGTRLGMGHLVRCLSLGDMLKKYFDVHFILQETENTVYDWIHQLGFSYLTIAHTSEMLEDCNETIRLLNENTTSPSLIVLDGYHFKTEYQQRLQDNEYRVVCIDDLHSWHQVADAIINHAPGISPDEYDTEKNTRLLLGTSYALLRPEILHYTKRRHVVKGNHTFLVSMGAADNDNCTLFFGELLLDCFSSANVHLLVSSLNPNLESIQSFASSHSNNVSLHINLNTNELIRKIEQCEVVICPASTISLEACAIGCTLITGYTAVNQQGILAGLTEHGAAYSLGHFQTLTKQAACDSIRSILLNTSAREEQLAKQQSLIDGKSPLRIARAFLEIARNANCRIATLEDAKQIFAWANDPEVRANSFNSEIISWKNHLDWYTNTLNSAHIIFLIYEINHVPTAQLRLNTEGNTATVSYSVDNAFRGKGLGTWLLHHIGLYVKLEYGSIEILQGWVKKSNTASLRAFRSAGFIPVEESDDRILFKLTLDLV
jgi:UDP-2,4-diacetamido-2,4,6-trideoxy-beta-L-altropyranose hydrolase